jgi:hypothetical protein
VRVTRYRDVLYKVNFHPSLYKQDGYISSYLSLGLNKA